MDGCCPLTKCTVSQVVGSRMSCHSLLYMDGQVLRHGRHSIVGTAALSTWYFRGLHCVCFGFSCRREGHAMWQVFAFFKRQVLVALLMHMSHVESC